MSSSAYADIVSTSNPSESSFHTGAGASSVSAPYSGTPFYSGQTGVTSDQYGSKSGYGQQSSFYPARLSGYNHLDPNYSHYSAAMGMPAVMGQEDGTMAAYGTSAMMSWQSQQLYAAAMGTQLFGGSYPNYLRANPYGKLSCYTSTSYNTSSCAH